MGLISAVHRWTGAFIGLLLAVLGISGAILVWEGEWVRLPGAGDPLREDVQAIATIAENAAAGGSLSRITFANAEIGLHQLTYAGGAGAYVRQDGSVVDRWNGQWERPELWLFDLHHHLFAGHTGETVAGIAGLAGLGFVVTGLILWWRGNRRLRLRLLPERLQPGPIVRHHRDLGVLAAPLLLLSLVTGTLMLFEPLRQALLGTEQRPQVALPAPTAGAPSPIAAALLSAKARFPDAALRRITLPGAAADGEIAVRMKQPAEWTPNGRSQLTFDARTGAPLSVEDPLAGNRAAWLSEKLYPLHSAKVGGLPMKLAMTASGLALFLLGSLATYGFWKRRAAGGRKRRLAARRRAAAPAGA
jgi:uncharacterized iron-regulated membrane protein